MDKIQPIFRGQFIGERPRQERKSERPTTALQKDGQEENLQKPEEVLLDIFA